MLFARSVLASILICAPMVSTTVLAQVYPEPQEKPWWKGWEEAPNWWLEKPPSLPRRNLSASTFCPAKFVADCMESYKVAREKNASEWVNFYGSLIQLRFNDAIERTRKAGDTNATAELIAERRKYPPEPNRVIGRMREDAERNYTEAVESWDGSEVMSLIKQWGPPFSEYKAPDGSLMLTYKTERSSFTDGDLTQFRCETTFTVKGQRIVDWRWRGNGCFAN